jgi:ribose transport system ATP-binding protein
MTIVYITHRLEEVMAVADRVTVLRDGRRVDTQPVADIDMAGLIELIVGRAVERALESAPREIDRSGTPLLELEGLTTPSGLRDVSLQVHAGEIVGLAGLMGSGRSELVRAVFGIDAIASGRVRLRGEEVAVRRPAGAIARGIVLVPEDRRSEGLVLDHSVGANLVLPMLRRLTRGGLVDDGAADRVADTAIESLGIRARSRASVVKRLSGGNQQKVVVGKWLATEPDVLMLDEPTVGVDVATKSEIVQLVRRLAGEGKGVIVISSELAELLAMADRIVVLRDGAVDRSLTRSEVADEPALHRLVQEAAA